MTTTDTIEIAKEAWVLLQDGLTADTVAAMVADDYEIEPVAVKRAFIAKYGFPLIGDAAEKVRAAEAAIETAGAARVTELREKARAVAREWRAEWTGADHDSRTGKIFTYNGEEYVFVVTCDAPKWFLKAVRVRDAAPRKMTERVWRKIYTQVK
jgi:hypothetical protein